MSNCDGSGGANWEGSAMSDEMTHVDDFIDDHTQHKYARWCLMLFRLSASNKLDFAEFTNGYTLFCFYEGKQYRVTGASRLGDIWLTSNFAQDCGYEKRVDVAACSGWSKNPTGWAMP